MRVRAGAAAEVAADLTQAVKVADGRPTGTRVTGTGGCALVNRASSRCSRSATVHPVGVHRSTAAASLALPRLLGCVARAH